MATRRKGFKKKGNKVNCYLYWIRLETHSDKLKEGYIGVSVNPRNRFLQHKYNAKSKKFGRKFNKDFKRNLLTGDVLLEILYEGTAEDCYNLELAYRPVMNIGWNIAEGGGGSSTRLKHGLTGTIYHKLYYNLRIKAEKAGGCVYDKWAVPETGLPLFRDYIKEHVKEGDIVVLDNPEEGMIPDNILFTSRTEMSRRAKASHKLPNSSCLKSVVELGEEFNMKPNSIITRLKRGWTLEEALLIEKRVSEKTRFVCVNNEWKEYHGDMTTQELLDTIWFYENGASTLTLATALKRDASALWRLLAKMGVQKGVCCAA